MHASLLTKAPQICALKETPPRVPASRVVLSCGTIVEGEPHDTDAYRATARELGYGDDTELMCAHHDPLHAALCRWLGFRDSFALCCAAGLREEDAISAAEESAVLAVQRFLRLASAAAPRSIGIDRIVGSKQ